LRLKHIHLAGFKSFVDPVTIPASAMLTGVVGPNGCGKSNVIDAVRWVLGESKARELRGESMQDVIFNGSATRKPAARASVELLFDNSDGSAPGQWSRYAEIAVKRVLTRNGESSYHINNVHVRKRDMADLFLGTGLGGDAYAIIEQGMISRIIEARPEELRGYLEEAAGVSKYKERRKETESRLRDARENLERVDDIRQELARQLERLTAQAEVARRYLALDGERVLKTRLLALTRKRGAQMRQRELAQLVASTREEIEAKVAELRRLESELETERLRQFEATEALNQAQAGYYGESAEVSRLEQEFKHLRETRQRLEGEIRAAASRRERMLQELDAIRGEIDQRQAEHADAEAEAALLAERAAAASDDLPEAEAAWREAQAAAATLQAEIGRIEQSLRLEEANQAHSDKNIEQLKAREWRLLQEKEGLTALDESHLARLQAELEEAEARVESLGGYLDVAREALPTLESAVREARRVQAEAQRERQRVEAELAALRKLQGSAMQAEREGAAWLERQGLAALPRLWQLIRVEPGWETAVEAALGEAMAALSAEWSPAWAEDPPEARFELALPAAGEEPPPLALLALDEHFRPLVDLIHTEDPVVARFLGDRLALTYAADSLAEALARRGGLPPGGIIATRQGHRVGRASLVFNAPEKGHHGVLERAREIAGLEEALAQAAERIAEVEEAVREAEAAFAAGRRQSEALQSQLTQARAEAHRLQVELVRAQEAARRLTERRARIEAELDEVYAQLESESEAYNGAAEREQAARLVWEAARARLDEARARRQAAEQRLQGVRETQRRAEREAQEAAFQVRTLVNRLNELQERSGRADRALLELALELDRLHAALEQAQEAPLQAALTEALERRQGAEATLVTAREALEACNARLQALETGRLGVERALEPMQQRLQDTELKLQEARLTEARYAEELEGVDETALADEARAAGLDGRPEAWLKAEIARLDGEIAALGAVNMAALDELEAAQARKAYLDAQAEDLTTAAATLEEAIRRIDAESRARLKDTYERVGSEFRALFAELFGGGNAELILTGEEILDAGLSVMAQPPGKKNSSIHLLSGGEKALTALALIFAFFRLNPAPFCLLDEVDAPLDDANTERYCNMVRKMSAVTQFLFITHNRLTMEMAQHLVGVTMPEPGVSRCVAVDVEGALQLAQQGSEVRQPASAVS
jgi:chromosome segregation protein